MKQNIIKQDNVDTTQKYAWGASFEDENAGTLDLSQLDIEIAIKNIDQYPNEEYALLRKDGIGTSDSSIVLGVNPYTTKAELIAEKCRTYLTPDEMEVGNKPAVIKGRELEPFIISKHSQIIGKRIIKPIDMYQQKEYPYIRFNYDGVIDKEYRDDGTYQYIPDEIKVVTYFGQKHYNRKYAYFRERLGYINDIPENHGLKDIPIENKAALYGIPPYYYTQLQQQIYGLNAPYGFLTVLFEKDWEIVSFFVWRDQKVINQLILEDTKIWNTIQRNRPIDFDLGVKIRE